MITSTHFLRSSLRIGIAIVSGLFFILAPTARAQDTLAVQTLTQVEEPNQLKWPYLAGGLVVLGGLALLDEPIRNFTSDLQSELGRDFARAASDYGKATLMAPIFLGGSILVGAVTDGGRGFKRAAAAGIGMAAGSLVNETLNRIVGRRRPSAEVGAWEFDPFHGHASFPSGHVAFTFAIAGAVDKATEGWVAIPFYTAATITGLTRIYLDRHWLTDVVVGSLIGVWMSRHVTRTAMRLLNVEQPTSLPKGSRSGARALLDRLEPIASPHFLGVRIRL
jgi:membrane-associated phospholipid phosphatase